MTGNGLSDHFRQYGLAWALGLSLLLHVLFIVAVPPFKIDAPQPKPPLRVELLPPPAPPAPPAPAEEIVPEPPKPEPKQPEPKPEPKPEPEPIPKPAPKKTVEEPPPAKKPEPQPVPEAPQEAPPPPPPQVIAAPPKVEEPPPVVTAPPPLPEPPKPSGPSEAELDTARQAYGNALSREIGKYKRYPRIAQMRGWQGTVRLLLEIDANGKVVSVKIEEASEREVFNAEAVEMVKRMVEPPPIPEALRGRSFSVRVPITFRLE